MSGFWRSQFRHFLQAYGWWRESVTLSGKALTLLLLFAFPGLVASDSALATFFAAAFVLAVFSYATGMLFRPRLSHRVSLVDVATVGEAFVVVFDVTNVSGRLVADLSVRLQDDGRLWLIEPGSVPLGRLDACGGARVTFQLRCDRRGVYRVPDLVATSTFPFGLFRHQARDQVVAEVVVLPRRQAISDGELGRLSSGRLRHDADANSRLGMTGEYIGSREYQPGISVRRWDYASWARLGRPVVREFSDWEQVQVVVVVDPFFVEWAGREGDYCEEFERTISYAAGLIEGLFGHGVCVVRLLVGDQEVVGGEGMRHTAESYWAPLARAQWSGLEPKWEKGLGIASAGRVRVDLAYLVTHRTDAQVARWCDWLSLEADELVLLRPGSIALVEQRGAV